MIDRHLNNVAQAANYGGAAGAITFWGLNLPDWAALISATIAILGFALQCYIALRKR